MAWCASGVLIWHNNKTKDFILMYLARSENIECVIHSAFSLTESNVFKCMTEDGMLLLLQKIKFSSKYMRFV